jgi:hypothetical protein
VVVSFKNGLWCPQNDLQFEGLQGCLAATGTLIATGVCAIPPEDTGDSRVRTVPGLGLGSGPVVGVPFGEGNALPHIVEAKLTW